MKEQFDPKFRLFPQKPMKYFFMQFLTFIPTYLTSVNYCTFKPLYLYIKTSLLCPGSVRKFNRFYCYHYSSFLYRLNISIVIFVTGMQIFFIDVDDFSWSNSEGTILAKRSSMPISLLFSIISTSIIAIYGVAKSKDNFNQLQSLYQTIASNNSRLDNRAVANSSRYIAVFIVSFNYVLIGNSIFKIKKSALKTTAYICHSFLQLISSAVIIQYIELVCFIKQLFAGLNRELIIHFEDYFKRNTEEHIKQNTGRKISGKSASRQRIQDLLQLFRKTCEDVQSINESHGSLVLILLVTHCLSIVVSFHRHPAYFERDVSTSFILLHKALEHFWVSFTCAKIFFLIVLPACTTFERIKTRMIVCKYMSPDIEKSFLAKLKTFVFNQKLPPAVFTATRFLELKLNLLISIIGVIATYFFILIQMDSAAKIPSDEKINKN